MSKDNRDKLIEDVGVGASIDPSDFNIQEENDQDGKSVFTCSRITNKAKQSLETIYASKFDAIGATVALDAAEYTLVKENDRTVSSVLTCHFTIVLDGQSYEIAMEISTEYDYDADFGLSIPAKSSSYEQVSYEEIFE